MRGSQEVIDINFGPNEAQGLVRQVAREQDAARGAQMLQVQGGSSGLDQDLEDSGITYEQMTAIIETVLMDCGYYELSNNRTLPLTPTGVSSSTMTAEFLRNGFGSLT